VNIIPPATTSSPIARGTRYRVLIVKIEGCKAYAIAQRSGVRGRTVAPSTPVERGLDAHHRHLATPVERGLAPGVAGERRRQMSKLLRGVAAGWGAKKMGGGCFSTILIFLLLWWLLGNFDLFR